MPLLRQIKKELESIHVNTDVSSRVDVDEARDELTTLLENAREGEREAQKAGKLAGLAGRGRLVRDAIEVFGSMIPPLERAVATFSHLTQEEAGRRLTRYQQEVFGRMREEFAWLKSQDLSGDPVTLDDLPAELRQRYLSPRGRILIEVDPMENIWQQEANERFVADLRSVDSRATGTPVQNYQYINLLKDSYVHAAVWAFAAILILISLHFRNPVRIALTLLPLFLGIVWTLGVMGWFRIYFNPANIITLPLVIGIGVAFGVYVVDRHREEGRVKLLGSSTGKAVLLSALTTIFGFGSMMTGKYVGLVSLGLVMTIGISFCFITASLVLPQVLALMDAHKRGE